MNAELFERYGWWAALHHDGLLIAPSKLASAFPETLPELDRGVAERLRRALVRVDSGADDAMGSLLDVVFEEVLGLEASCWLKGSSVDRSWSRKAMTGEVVRPARVWVGPHGAVLPVFYPDATSGGLRGASGIRLGTGKGKRVVARVIEWLRGAEAKIALIATGRQLRLVHAGPDYVADCEWDTARWFEEGAPGQQVVALRALLGAEALTPPAEGKPSRLLAAIQDSRQGQAELSQALGERVRQAVELLIGASSEVLAGIDAEGQPPSSRRGATDRGAVSRRDIYIAATRIVMRCVIILFAEARDLLPRSNEIYASSYGLQSLRAQLDRLAGGRSAERLRTAHSAWPRLLSLFSLVYDGSGHPALPIPRYAGGLFRPGHEASDDPILRALAAFESPRNAPPDAIVHRMLELLCRTKVKVRQGRASRVVEAPVDFSDLSSEYIGILYEGLLDFELRRVAEDDVVLFLNLGDQPALPFQRLNDMSNDELTELFGKLKKSENKHEAADTGGEESEDSEDAPGEEPQAEDDSAGAGEEDDDLAVASDGDDRSRSVRLYVQEWAERAVKAAKLVRYPRNDRDPRVREQFARDVAQKARELVRRIALPGEWYVVRWGGTRKGSGTFYTRPQIAGPTVRRALQPLAYEETSEEGETRWVPRKPEQILALKVCDPAMGSGSFLVSALRYLTDALQASLHHHGRLEQRPDGALCRLAEGVPANHPGHELLPMPPDHPDFEERLRARLKRHVVERCLYGVDLDPLAVELGRLSLWVETMDRELQFGFLDHKLKCGNSLVGCWFDRFQEYPILAWEREGGDKDHVPVNHFRETLATRGTSKGQVKRTGDKWTAAIRETRDDVIKPALVSWLTQRAALASGQVLAEFAVEGRSADDLHQQALEIFEELHSIVPISDADRRADLYAEKILKSLPLQRLRLALDTWCALWFWPAEELELAPKPSDFLTASDETLARVRRIAAKQRFFHWELEFPDVYSSAGAGFDAVVGNPPWEIQKPNSMEFFSNIDPLYRTYGKQEALERQRELFTESPEVEERWIEYCGQLKALSNWTKNAAFPFGKEGELGTEISLGRGRDVEPLEAIWRERRLLRKGYGDREHPFRHQGSADINTYKMFLETAHALLRVGGGLGFLVPSGLYTDNGSRALRELFLDHCTWTHLYAFQNERFVFEGIHHSFKMAVVHVTKGGATEALRTRFRLGPGDSPTAPEIEEDLPAEAPYLAVTRESILRFCPKSGALLEVTRERDLQVIERLYEGGAPLGDSQDWRIVCAREFHMTDDSKLFPDRTSWEARGYVADSYGNWVKGAWQQGQALGGEENRIRSADGAASLHSDQVEDVAVPLLQGIMLRAFECTVKGWVSGSGSRATWRTFETGQKRFEPHFLMQASLASRSDKMFHGWKLAYRQVARSTDTRTWISAPVCDLPGGHSLFFLSCPGHEQSMSRVVELAGILNSYVFDWLVRLRMGGANLSWFIVEEAPLPADAMNAGGKGALVRLAWMLAGAHLRFAPSWWNLSVENEWVASRPWKSLWCITPAEVLRVRVMLDAIAAELYGLSLDDFSWILRDCDHPVQRVFDKPFSRTLDPKGFWRVDKEQPPELRHTVLSLVAFHELKKVGLDAFLALNDGDGWMLPETLRLADYGLGHDARAKEHQPVAAALGPRFLPWQLEQGVEESWEECRRHAELIAKILPMPSEPAEPVSVPKASGTVTTGPPKAGETDLFGQPLERDLFGNPVVPRGRSRRKS